MINPQAREFVHISGEIDSLYHEAALKFGVSDSVLNTLYVLCEKEINVYKVMFSD